MNGIFGCRFFSRTIPIYPGLTGNAREIGAIFPASAIMLRTGSVLAHRLYRHGCCASLAGELGLRASGL